MRHNLLGSSRSISKRSHNYSHQTYCQAHTELFVHEHQKFDDKMNSRIVWQECMCSHLLHMNTSCWKTTLWPLPLKEIGKWEILSITFPITLSIIIPVMIIHNITYNIGGLNILRFFCIDDPLVFIFVSYFLYFLPVIILQSSHVENL